MKRLYCLLLGLGCIANASAQLKTESILPREAIPATTAPVVYDSLTNIRVTGDPACYASLVGQRILFFARDINAALKPAAFCNFLTDTPAAVRIDTVWLRKPRKKVRPEDFRLDTLYSDAYRPRLFKNEEVVPFGCTLFAARGLGKMDYSGIAQTGWFTPAEAVEGRSFEVLGVEKCKIEDSELLLFRLRDAEGGTCYWFAHSGKDTSNLRDEYYPAVVEGMLEKYRAECVGRDFFLTGRKPEAKGYTSSFGLTTKTMQGGEEILRFGTELHCTDVRLIGDGTGYAVPSFVFEKKEDGTPVYIPLTRYPQPFGIEGYMLQRERAFLDELELTPSEVVYARRAEEERQRELERLQREKEQKERKAMLYRKYGKSDAELILQNRVRIGMTRAMCREAWGVPDDINTMSGSWGTHEQWVYNSGSYLYFENGRLTSIQN